MKHMPMLQVEGERVSVVLDRCGVVSNNVVSFDSHQMSNDTVLVVVGVSCARVCCENWLSKTLRIMDP